MLTPLLDNPLLLYLVKQMCGTRIKANQHLFKRKNYPSSPLLWLQTCLLMTLPPPRKESTPLVIIFKLNSFHQISAPDSSNYSKLMRKRANFSKLIQEWASMVLKATGVSPACRTKSQALSSSGSVMSQSISSLRLLSSTS